MDNILPDSRLRDPKASIMTDWPLAGGGTVRLELVPIYCFNCGKPNGYVPNDVVSFVSWLCLKCSESFGEMAAGWYAADQKFWADVEAEMKDRFGRVLTQAELEFAAASGMLGSKLEKLEKESPYVVT